MESIPDAHYFRYADDLLVLSMSQESAVTAIERMEAVLSKLRLTTKASHEQHLLLSPSPVAGTGHFRHDISFRHLGLQFCCDGVTSLSRDKSRKIQNLFRFAFRRGRRRWKKISDPLERARTLIAIASQTIDRGVRNVAILDYYLRHVTDLSQLRLLDRWLAEEILSLVFGGHRKGNFAKIGFDDLRRFGLPSLVHRHRLICHGKIESPFFIWQQQKIGRAFKGTVASRERSARVASDFSRFPKAAAQEKSVREDGRLYMGAME